MSDFGGQLRALAAVSSDLGADRLLTFLAGIADEQASRVDRVLALHHPTEARILTVPVCNECSWNADRFDQVEWPCDTVRILRGDEQ